MRTRQKVVLIELQHRYRFQISWVSLTFLLWVDPRWNQLATTQCWFCCFVHFPCRMELLLLCKRHFDFATWSVSERPNHQQPVGWDGDRWLDATPGLNLHASRHLWWFVLDLLPRITSGDFVHGCNFWFSCLHRSLSFVFEWGIPLLFWQQF